MAEQSKIEWCDHTFNPWEGCQKVGPGCDHCYAETRNARYGGGIAVNWGPGAPRRRTSAANWRKPLAWNDTPFYQCSCGWRGAETKPWKGIGICCPTCEGRLYPARQRVFCASLADVFDNAVDPQWRVDLLELIAKTPNLDWLLLTKRIGNVIEMIDQVTEITHGEGWQSMWTQGVPPENVWLGISVVNQAEADRDIPKLLAVPARTRFLSMEPLLGSADVFSSITGELLHTSGDEFNPGAIDWIIAGGESGPGARPMHPEWARSLRDQCAAASVPFLFKQWGEWHESDLQPAAGREKHLWSDGKLMYRFGKKAAGRILDGRTWDEYPAAQESGRNDAKE